MAQDWREEFIRLEHHAYCIEGDHTAVVPELRTLFEERLKVRIAGNPDVFIIERETFSIDDAHEISSRASRKSFSGDTMFFVLIANSLGHEAQNALLKTFEDPQPGRHFILVVPHVEAVVPTLRSRFMHLSGKGISTSKKDSDILRFLGLTPRERLVMVKKMTDAIADGDMERSEVARFIERLEREVYRKMPGSAPALRMLISTERDSASAGASMKILLERVALLLPRYAA